MQKTNSTATKQHPDDLPNTTKEPQPEKHQEKTNIPAVFRRNYVTLYDYWVPLADFTHHTQRSEGACSKSPRQEHSPAQNQAQGKGPQAKASVVPSEG